MNVPTQPQADPRLAALRAYDILDTPPDQDFDDIAALAAQICEAPVAMVNLVDADRQWTKAAFGTELAELPLDEAICPWAMRQADFVEIPDTRADPRTEGLQVCCGDQGVRFYAGAALTTADGHPIGSLCVLDREPRQLTLEQARALRILARQVMKMLDLRRSLDLQQTLAQEVDHRVKNSLQSVSALTRVQRRAAQDPAVQDALELVETRIEAIAALHEQLYRTGAGGEVGLAEYISNIAGLLSQGLPPGVSLVTRIEPVQVDSRQAAALAVIVQEIVTNSIKHAFGDGATGTVRITGRREPDGTYLLEGRDGQPVTAGGAGGTGLGLRIITASAVQLGGSGQFDPGPDGFVTSVRIPLS